MTKIRFDNGVAIKCDFNPNHDESRRFSEAAESYVKAGPREKVEKLLKVYEKERAGGSGNSPMLAGSTSAHEGFMSYLKQEFGMSPQRAEKLFSEAGFDSKRMGFLRK